MHPALLPDPKLVVYHVYSNAVAAWKTKIYIYTVYRWPWVGATEGGEQFFLVESRLFGCKKGVFKNVRLTTVDVLVHLCDDRHDGVVYGLGTVAEDNAAASHHLVILFIFLSKDSFFSENAFLN